MSETAGAPALFGEMKPVDPPSPAVHLTFFVHAIPRPGGSKRAIANKVTGKVNVIEDSAKNRDWRTAVREACLQVYKGPPLWIPLRLEVTFYFLRPRGHYGSGKNSRKLKGSSPKFPAVKPDLTKLVRATEDSLNGVLWRDDTLIVKQVLGKEYADRPGALISVSAVT